MKTPRALFLSAALIELSVLSCASAPPPAAPPPPPPPPPPAPAVVAPAASPVGTWLGTLTAGPQNLRLQLRLDSDVPGAPRGCFVDSLDQGGFGIECRYVPSGGGAAAGAFSIEVPPVMGKWTGTISADGGTLMGTWSQGGDSAPLAMARQSKTIEAPKVVLQPALPAPVDAAGLKAVLDADLAAALERGALAPATGTGVAIGVVTHAGGVAVRRVYAYGAVKPDSLFEIGSVTKTFTGLILAQMAEQKKVRLDEPVRELLPAGTVAKPDGPEITLVDLSDQHSGLPRMPENFSPRDPTNPYADYDEKALFAFLAQHGVALEAKDGHAPPPFGYSNLGVGLLGHALARRAGVKYEALLRQQITGPLGMRDTVITLTPAQKARLAIGHDGEHKPAHVWELDALVGAGGIRSTADDMLTYLEAQLHPERLAASASMKATAAGKTMAAAIADSHVVHAQVGDGMEIALNWFHALRTGSYWHNGGTGGYSAFAQFSPVRDFAVVVLCNADDTTPSSESFADKVGSHIAQRLMGLPALALAPAQ